MNKEQFLNELTIHLSELSIEERQDVLQDFAEHFEIGLAKGESEEQIASSLGSPKIIARDILAEYNLGTHHVERWKEKQDPARTVMVSILLILFNLIIVLGPLLGVYGTVISGWIVSFVFILSPFLVLFKYLSLAEQTHLFELFFSIGLVGVGIIIGIIMYYVTRFIFQLSVRYVNFNIRVAKGEN